MTHLCSTFCIFVASVDPLSKNKSRIIIQKCRNFCKQLTLPGRTVQQLPFFKTVRLYTVHAIALISLNGLCTSYNKTVLCVSLCSSRVQLKYCCVKQQSTNQSNEVWKLIAFVPFIIFKRAYLRFVN